jgi:hypothetical protein
MDGPNISSIFILRLLFIEALPQADLLTGLRSGRLVLPDLAGFFAPAFCLRTKNSGTHAAGMAAINTCVDKIYTIHELHDDRV